MSLKILCISAGQLETKKTNHIIHRRNRYLNYGLLSIATALKNNGLNPIQVQGNFDSPMNTFKKVLGYGLKDIELPILISVPSFYAVNWTNEFINVLKSEKPNVKVIIGGRWVIDDEIEQMASLVPKADYIYSGVIKEDLVKILQKYSTIELPSSLFYIGKSNHLDYTLLDERHLYQPSIEVSRGCGMKCDFCQEGFEPLEELKSPKAIIKEAESIFLDDGLIPMNFYLEASMFKPTRKWATELVEEVKQSKLKRFYWRTEARVDNINVELLEVLYKGGLRAIDLGLESASHIQLINMGKTKKPEKYLERASSFIKSAFNLGIMVKVNILLYPGETEKTLKETKIWLDNHRKYIKGLSVGPVIIFGWDNKVDDYLSKLSTFGATVESSPLHGVKHLNLSEEISFEKSIAISSEIGKEFISKDDYFELKSFSYFSRDYLYDDFVRDSETVESKLNYRKN